MNNTRNDIYMLTMPQIVAIRKYNIDIEKLKELLRSHKIISNKKISEMLKIPKTKVDHWFRTDRCFAIPDANIWYKLKDILNIKTDEFDKGITEFIYKPGVYEKSERYYLDYGIAPTITCGEELKIIMVRA